MNYMIEKMTEVELLQMLVAIENKRNTGFVDIKKANQRLEEYDASKRKEKLSQMLLQSQSDFSREELLQYMLQQEQGNTSKNKGIVAQKNADNTADEKAVLSALKQALNNLCGAKRFSGLSFSKETAIWLVENKMTADERRLLFNINRINKVDYEKLVSAITRKQREFAKEVGAKTALVGKLGKEYRDIFDNMCARYMA